MYYLLHAGTAVVAKANQVSGLDISTQGAYIPGFMARICSHCGISLGLYEQQQQQENMPVVLKPAQRVRKVIEKRVVG